jgi:hypothetical protein
MMSLPPLRAHGVDIPEIESKRKELHETHRALRMAESALMQLQQRREQAQAEDITAAVHAKRKGAKDPGDRHQKALETKIKKQQREISVLKGLESELTSEAFELMRDHAQEILDTLRENLKGLNEHQLEAIMKLEAVRSSRQALLRAADQVNMFVPSELAYEQGSGTDILEVVVHSRANFEMNDQQMQKALAQLRAECGAPEQLEAIREQEDPGTTDVFFPISLKKPAGRIAFEERRAEREAQREAEQAEAMGG